MTDTTDQVTPTRSYAWWGVVAVAAAAIGIVGGNTDLQPGENGGTGPLIVSLLVCAALAAWLFLKLVPDAKDPAKAGLILGIISVLSLIVFWSGLPVVLGAAAAALGLRAGSATMGRVALVLGAIAFVLGVVVGFAQWF